MKKGPTLRDLAQAWADFRDALAEVLLPAVRWLDQHRVALLALGVLLIGLVLITGIFDIIEGR